MINNNIVIMMARVMMVIMTMIVTFLSQKVRKGLLTENYSLHSRAFSGFRGWADDGEEEGDEVEIRMSMMMIQIILMMILVVVMIENNMKLDIFLPNNQMLLDKNCYSPNLKSSSTPNMYNALRTLYIQTSHQGGSRKQHGAGGRLGGEGALLGGFRLHCKKHY